MSPIERLQRAIAEAEAELYWLALYDMRDNEEGRNSLMLDWFRPVLAWMHDQLARMERDVEAVSDESKAIHYRHVLAVADAVVGGGTTQ